MINRLLRRIFQPENSLVYLKQLLQLQNIPWYRIDLNIKKWWLESQFEVIARESLKELDSAFYNIHTIDDPVKKERMIETLFLRLDDEISAYYTLSKHSLYRRFFHKDEWYESKSTFWEKTSTLKLELFQNKLINILTGMLSILSEDSAVPLRLTKDKWTNYAIQHDNLDWLYDIECAFKNTEYALVEGPLQQSIYTDQLITIVQNMLSGKNFQFKKERDQTVLTMDNHDYNWSKIMQFANLEHIKLQPEDMLLYSAYINNLQPKIGYLADTQCTLNPALEESYRLELYANAALNYDYIEPLISFQEMQAIHMYTTEWSRLINGILRSAIDIHLQKPSVVKFALIQAIFCASGLNKLPKIKSTQYVTRGENYRMEVVPEKILAQRMQIERTKAAAIRGVVEMKGFSSTSMRWTAFSSKFFRADVQLKIVPSKGANISSISALREEQEFLIPPTRMRVTECSGQGRYFTFQPVSDLNFDNEDLSQEEQVRTSTTSSCQNQ